MKKTKLTGIILIIVGLLTVAGIVINHHILWTIIDILVVITCIGSGIYLYLLKRPA